MTPPRRASIRCAGTRPAVSAETGTIETAGLPGRSERCPNRRLSRSIGCGGPAVFGASVREQAVDRRLRRDSFRIKGGPKVVYRMEVEPDLSRHAPRRPRASSPGPDLGRGARVEPQMRLLIRGGRDGRGSCPRLRWCRRGERELKGGRRSAVCSPRGRCCSESRRTFARRNPCHPREAPRNSNEPGPPAKCPLRSWSAIMRCCFSSCSRTTRCEGFVGEAVPFPCGPAKHRGFGAFCSPRCVRCP